jgi:hypothetical protein
MTISFCEYFDEVFGAPCLASYSLQSTNRIDERKYTKQQRTRNTRIEKEKNLSETLSALSCARRRLSCSVDDASPDSDVAPRSAVSVAPIARTSDSRVGRSAMNDRNTDQTCELPESTHDEQQRTIQTVAVGSVVDHSLGRQSGCDPSRRNSVRCRRRR